MKTPIRLMILIFSIQLLVASQNASGQTGKDDKPSQEKFVRIIAVRGNQISVMESGGAGGGGRAGGGAGGRRGGMGANQNAGSGFGRGRGGRGRMQGGQSRQGGQGQATSPMTILNVDDKVQLTTATQERRTNLFRVGADINGRLRNELFRQIPAGGLSARIVTAGNRLIAVNVIQANDTSLEDIAVKPKRPPRSK